MASFTRLRHRRMQILAIALAGTAIALAAACGGDGDDEASAGDTRSLPTQVDATREAPPTFTPVPTPEPGTELSTREIVRLLRPSVVRIVTGGAALGDFDRATPPQGLATGVIVDEQGHIITNHHVLRVGDELADRIIVTLHDERSFPARIVGTDGPTDLAVIKIDADGLVPAVLGESASLEVGAEVVAIGHALGLAGDPTVTRGVVSAKDRAIRQQPYSIGGAIQTDASINPGNSGGPLVDVFGRVVGINTAIIQGAQNIGFAISIDLAKPILQELLAQGEVRRARLGASVIDITPSLAVAFGLPTESGVGITGVDSDSPADAAGLAVEDIIVRFAGRQVANSGDLLQALNAHQAGDTVAIQFFRGTRLLEARVTLAERTE